MGSVQRDSRFLSSVIQSADNSLRKLDLVAKNTQMDRELVRFRILASNARLRGISFQSSPPIYQRHQKNISFFFLKTKTIFWNVEVLFVGRRGDSWTALAHLADPLPETSTLPQIFDTIDFNHPRLQTFFDRSLVGGELLGLIARGEFRFWLGGEKGPSCVPVERESPEAWDSATLNELLTGRTVVEFPTFLVMPAALAGEFSREFRGWREWETLG